MALDGPGIAAILGGAGAGIAAVIGALRIQGKTAAQAPEPDRPTPEQVAAVPADPEGIREFMAILRADNEDLRRELRDVREREHERDRAMAEMQTDIGADKKWKADFLEALGRWVARIYAEWGKGGQFPFPDKDDAAILNDVLPRPGR